MSRRTVVDPRFAARLRQLRAARSLSLSGLASAAHIAKSHVSELERGIKRPGVDIAAALDRALGAGGELVEMVTEPEPRQATKATGTPYPLSAGAPAAYAAIADAIRPGASLPAFTRLEVDEILAHLREQWHALVRTDNLLGPRHALDGVLSQLTVLAELLHTLGGRPRREVAALAAQFAESAGWLNEDSGHLVRAQLWTVQAMEWAYEADDTTMLAWTAYRRSQQSAAVGDARRSISLAQSIRRKEDTLAGPIKAAVRVQEACGHALAGDERPTLQLLDDAHQWASDDSAGDARNGHGSFCTASYIEITRAGCLLRLGRAVPALACYEQALPTLPTVYSRDRAAALAGKASAHAAAGEPEQAAATAQAALPVARRAGSRRIVNQVERVGQQLAQHRRLPAVADLLHNLAEGS